ncbi:MAG: YkgJ family cysteine cluster protein [Crenarchaeota archaeon]|nr:YkgJ family cysteine cluster protein [Thermoproteota archaeon]
MTGGFKCLHCIHCCFFAQEWESPIVFPWEKRLLERMLNDAGLRGVFAPVEAYGPLPGGGCVVVLYRWVVRGFCPFYDSVSRRCMIHELKPLACRMFPLLLELPSGRLMLSAACDAVRPPIRGGVERVFPVELRAAETVLLLYTGVVERLRSLGLERVDASKCGGLVDADIYLEMLAGGEGWGVEGD